MWHLGLTMHLSLLLETENIQYYFVRLQDEFGRGPEWAVFRASSPNQMCMTFLSLGDAPPPYYQGGAPPPQKEVRSGSWIVSLLQDNCYLS